MDSETEAARDPRVVRSHSSFTERDFEGHHALTMYVGVHVLDGRHRRHHHHHHHHHRVADRLHRESRDMTKPSTPPSERVRFIIGSDEDESHSPHPVFSEMEELFWTGNKMEWMETARWIKFEEDVEEGGNRWSKPHIATVSLHALLVLRSSLLNGSVLLDAKAETVEVIADFIVRDLTQMGQLLPEHQEYVKRVLLCKHRHKEEQYYALWNDNKPSLHPVKSLADIVLCSKSGGSQRSGSTSYETGSKEFPRNFSMPPLSQTDELKDEADVVCSGATEDSSAQTESEDRKEEYKWCNASFMKKIPQDAQASNILVGELPFLDRAVTAFVRLENACLLGNLTEFPLPTKFIFVILCPANNIERYHEVGRAFATVMSDEVFHDVAYKAKVRGDLLSGIDEFMDAATVLPASAWDPATRIEPLPMMISQEARKNPETKDAGESDQGSETSEEWKHSGLKRTGKLFGGLISDVQQRAPFYWSDFTDFFAFQSIASVIFLFFACLAPIITFGGLLGNATHQRMAAMENLLSSFICGVFYGLFSGQPLTIVGNTGALLVFEGTIFSYCNWWDIDYLPFRLWTGLWTSAILFLFVAFDASVLICYITRFTEEVFATLISVIFIVKAFQNVMNIGKIYPMKSSAVLSAVPVCQCSPHRESPFSNITYLPADDCVHYNRTLVPDTCVYPLHYVPNVYLFSLILFAGTFTISFGCRKLRESPYFPIKVRYFMADFGAAIGMISMTVLDACLKLDTPKLSVPEHFKPTWPERDWLIPFFGRNPWWTAAAAVLPALVATILIFMDQQLTAVIVNRKENKLKKGCGYHLDLFVVAILITVCSAFGLPWAVAATMLSMTHVTSLEVIDENAAPGEKPHFIGIREQRGTSICIFILIGLSIFFTPVLRLIPMPVLYGIFLYMGVSSLKGLQFLTRVLIYFMPQKYQPDYMFLRKIPLKVLHCFTAIQLICLLVLFVIKCFPESALFFPAGLILVIIVRRRIFVRFFSEAHLKILDDDTPELIKQRNEEYQSADNLYQPHTASTICGANSSKGPMGKEMQTTDSCILNISESLLQSSLWKCIDQQVHKTPPLVKKLSQSSLKKKKRSKRNSIEEDQQQFSELGSDEETLRAQPSTSQGYDNPSIAIKNEGVCSTGTSV